MEQKGSNPPKILFIGSFLSQHSGSLCASEKLSQLLQPSGYKVKLVSRQENKILRLLEIIFFLIKENADFVHIDVYSGQAFIITEVSTWICNLLKKKYILTLHGGALPDFFSKAPDRVLNVLKKARHITTPSKMLKIFFEGKGISVRYIPNSIDLTHFEYNRTNVRPYSLLWVRAFDTIYNPAVAIEAFSLVHEKYPQATLTMVGPDKGLLPLAQKLIAEKDLGQSIHIVGPVPNDELSIYYQTHEVFLNTTSYESFGVAVMEAAACGIPIISSKVGEIPFLWEHEQDILMIDEINPHLFAKSIVQILENQELSRKLSGQACKRAQTFQWPEIQQSWLTFLSELK